MFPVNRLNMIKKTFDPQPFSHGVSNSALASYPACNSEGESDDIVVNTDCFSGYDPSILMYLFRAPSVWWRCAQYFVIASCG